MRNITALEQLNDQRIQNEQKQYYSNEQNNPTINKKKYSIEDGVMYQDNGEGKVPLQY